MKRILVLLLSLLLLGGCGHTQQEEPLPSMTEPMAADHTQWQQEPYYVLQFNVDSVISNAPAAAATSAGVVLTQGGTYLLSGTLQDAQLIIDVPAGETVRLVLRGVDLHSERGPVIYSKGGCTVVLLLEEGTVNTLTDGKNYLYTGGVMREAVISVTGSLLITGSGSLAVEATHADAIRSESDLVVAAGSLTVTAWRDGLIGGKSLTISGGQQSITCGDTGLIAPSEKSGQGSLLLSGGNTAIVSGGDGIRAAGTLSTSGGSYHITTGGGSSNRSYGEDAEKWGLWGGLQQEQPPEQEGALPSRETPVSASARGLSAGKSLVLGGGSFTLDCSDDALYSAGSLLLSGGSAVISGGDDAIFAAGQVTLSSGEITIDTARRGLTAESMTLSGGSLTLNAAEEGLLLSGGYREEEVSTSPEVRRMTVTGGSLQVRAGTHAIDMAGSFFQSGGTLLLGSGREQNPLHGPVAHLSGGTLLAAGPLLPGTEWQTSLPRISVELWLTGGRPLTVTAAEESAPMLSFTPETSVGYVTLISDRLQPETTYYLVSGSARLSVTPE